MSLKVKLKRCGSISTTTPFLYLSLIESYKNHLSGYENKAIIPNIKRTT